MAEGIVYLDPEIAGEGQSANNWDPGAWTIAPNVDGEEYQPEMEPPHINDYGAMKKHKHYKQYFRPYTYKPFPAFVYHATLGEKIVKSKEEVFSLGPDWHPFPVHWHHPQHGERVVSSQQEIAELGQGWAPFSKAALVGGPGKSLPVKTDMQRLAETLAEKLPSAMAGKSAVDPAFIASIVAATAAALQPKPESVPPADQPVLGGDPPSGERDALLAQAQERGVKIDGRWSNARIKETLGVE